jgi:RimJ/RimL family protein N-acetyltransferase
MKDGARIETPRLVLRHWRDDDIEEFHRLNNDERVMRFFATRRTREQCLELFALIRKGIAEHGIGFCALVDRQTDRAFGFGGLGRVSFEASFTPAVEVGWWLAPEYWGKGLATEAANALLEHGFTECGLDEIVAFAVHNNHASTAVMRRIGMTACPEHDFDHPRVPDTHEHLKRHVLYRIGKDEWRAHLISAGRA